MILFIFFFWVNRRANDIGESSEYIVGEEEAVWALKLILPFINEFLLKIRALFSGDPATTMKVKSSNISIGFHYLLIVF